MDVILDMVGGDYIQRNMAAAAVWGRIVNIAYQKGAKARSQFRAPADEAADLDGHHLARRGRRPKKAPSAMPC